MTILWHSILTKQPFSSLNCAGVDVPAGHCWDVRQCGRTVVLKGRMGKRRRRGRI